MSLEDALRAATDALTNWAEYLEENDREDEVERYDTACAVISAHLRLHFTSV